MTVTVLISYLAQRNTYRKDCYSHLHTADMVVSRVTGRQVCQFRQVMCEYVDMLQVVLF